MNKLRLGIIGGSDGNGHPYSWAAIFNGYDRVEMESCEFPVIPRYLQLQNFPNDFLSSATVTHIWTQSIDLSRKIARTSLIKNIVDNFEEMIGFVDAILLARDDAENHLTYAAPFLRAGLPVYIDKPLALSVEACKHLLSLQKYENQIFSCSALRYAKEFDLSREELEKLGPIIEIKAGSPKSWDKYAMHIIEPSMKYFWNESMEIKEFSHKKDHCDSSLNLILGDQKKIQLTCLGDDSLSPIFLNLIGKFGSRELIFNDSFYAFKMALNEFICNIRGEKVKYSKQYLLDSVKILELGRSE